MLKHQISLLIAIALLLFSPCIRATQPCHPFYVGVTGGVGSTTWGNLVAKNMNDALSTSVPINVSEGGTVYGIYIGYKCIPAFSIELSYMQYPTAQLTFDEMSLFTYNHNNRTQLTTQTSRIALMGKFLLLFPQSNFRVYSSLGPAEVHRNDAVVDRWRLSPAFGAGIEYDVARQWMIELGTEYVAGYGQSELDPAQHFIPFLYSVFLRAAYRF